MWVYLSALAQTHNSVILTHSLPVGSSELNPQRRSGSMVEPMLIDLKAILVEREDCDAGTVQKIREALAQGKTQYRTLRDVTDVLKKRAEAATGAQAKRWHLKLGIASFFLGHLGDAVENLKLAE